MELMSSWERKGYEKGLEIGQQEGRREGEQRFLIGAGSRRFGPPNEATLSRLEATTSQDELERLVDRLLDVETWDDLLA